MSILAIATRECDRYRRHFLISMEALAADHGHIVGELLISINDESLNYPYRQMRVDAISKDRDGANQIFELRGDLDTSFEPVGFNFGQFVLEVYPFTWDCAQLAFNSMPRNLTQIEGWLTRWIDVDDKCEPNSDGTHGAIHSASPIETNDGWWFLTIDFGSAPPDALLELIELLAGQDMSRIVLTSGRA